MRARAAFAFSLLAALGIHAVILLAPRAALVGETKVLPTVLIDLSETPTVMAMSAAAAPAPAPVPSTQKPASLPPPRAAVRPAPPQEPPPAAANETERQAESGPVQPADTTPALLPGPATAAEQAASAPADGEPAAGPTPVPALSRSSAAGSRTGTPGGPAAPSPIGTHPNGPGIARAASGSDLVAPRPRIPIQPAYPRAARLSGAQGLVKVTAMVDERGAVTGVEVLLSSGSSSLDRAALDAVLRTTFEPALQAGKPVPCKVTVPIRFQLSASGR